MKYLELKFLISPYSQDASDILTALSAEAGLESFVETPEGLKGYAPLQHFAHSKLDEVISRFPLQDTRITYTIAGAEDKNWNETWEKNGFSSILIADKVWIHNGQCEEHPGAEYEIVINPHQAFGTGGHQTTSMIIERLYAMDLQDKSILDAGCGTGILGIFCALKGAKEIFAYDIDDWSIRNTLENMELNGISNMKVTEGDASVLKGKGPFDLILANINRNILMTDLPVFASVMHKGSQIILSGFYTEDIPLLVRLAHTLSLHAIGQSEKDNWASLWFEKE